MVNAPSFDKIGSPRCSCSRSSQGCSNSSTTDRTSCRCHGCRRTGQGSLTEPPIIFILIVPGQIMVQILPRFFPFVLFPQLVSRIMENVIPARLSEGKPSEPPFAEGKSPPFLPFPLLRSDRRFARKARPEARVHVRRKVVQIPERQTALRAAATGAAEQGNIDLLIVEPKPVTFKRGLAAGCHGRDSTSVCHHHLVEVSSGCSGRCHSGVDISCPCAVIRRRILNFDHAFVID